MLHLEVAMLVDRIDTFAGSLSSAQYVFSRPEAQAEHDLVLGSAQAFSKRWGWPLVWVAIAGVLESGLVLQYLSVTQTFLPPQEAVRTIVLAFVMWSSAASVQIAGKRLEQQAVGVSESRISLKGMLGRTSWCKYFQSVPIEVSIPGGFVANSTVVGLALVVVAIPCMFLGFDPRLAKEQDLGQ